jgi:FkbH-like protein
MTDTTHHDDYHYRVPHDLSLSATKLQRVLVIGSCLVGGVPDYIRSVMPDCAVDYILFNNLSELPETPPHPADSYDFQFIQIPLRSVLRDYFYFRAADTAPETWEQIFEQSRDQLLLFLNTALRWNASFGLLTFVSNFMVPQQNPHGRLLPRYELSNPVYFVERLNQCLDEELRAHANVHLIDLDQIAATYGRKYIQDDGVWQLNHGAVLGDADAPNDQARIAPVPPVSALYTLRAWDFVQSMWLEIVSHFRTLRQADSVKLVIVDLDDTLWRGVAAELEDNPNETLEGWPLGMAEALGFLRRRGVLLAIVSKNDEATIEGIWNDIFQGRLSLDDFAVRRINWEPKVDNIDAVIREVNVLPRSVLFIDDNPVERAAVQQAFPDIRILGENQYLLRRILLWAPELQVPFITSESARRTEMIQANTQRQTARTRLSRAEFLATLDLRVRLSEITDTTAKPFARALELLNKTNQFNTTGRRWTLQEAGTAFASGTIFYVFEVEDRYSQYGLVGVVIAAADRIEQMVMSCRVVGLDVEIAVMAEILRRMRRTGTSRITARLVETDANLLCRNVFERAGFTADGEDTWISQTQTTATSPAHIKIEV